MMTPENFLQRSSQVATAAPAAVLVEITERGRAEKLSPQIRRSVVLLFKVSRMKRCLEQTGS